MKLAELDETVGLGDSTIASRIRRIVVLTSGTALLCASLTYLVSEVVMYRADLVGSLEVLADVVGTNSTAALAFDDVETGTRVLRALEAEPAVRGAALYSADGRVFAVFSAEGGRPPELRQFTDMTGQVATGHAFDLRTLHLWRPILVGDELAGQVLLSADLGHIYAMVRRLGALVAVVFVVLMTGVYFWSNGLQRKISGPVRDLAAGMETVSSRQNYALRIEAEHDDEIGALIRGFNSMLSQIEQRDGKLEAYRDELEQRVEERTADLLRARDSAEAASRAKSEFLATMSHEIRTPMNGVLGMTELLANSALNPRQYRLARTAYRSAELLLGVINNILDFSKIEAGHLELSPTDFGLRPLVEDVVDVLADQAHRKGLELRLDLEPAAAQLVTGDTTRLRQILINLLGNAVKFTDTGEVRLVVRLLREDETGLHLSFTVADTGPGIALDRQKRIFEPFLQEDGSISRRHGGTGLGLTITRKLLDLMGSTLHLESTPGEGSSFSFEITLAKTLQPDDKTSRAREQLAGARLLIADGNSEVVEALQDLMSGWKLQVGTAQDVVQAKRLLREAANRGAPYRLALIDFCLPGSHDGEALVRDIKRDPQLPGLHVVAMSGDGNDLTTERALRAGAVDCLCKPVRHNELRDCLLNLLGSGDRSNAEPGSSRIHAAAEARRVLLAEDNTVNQEVALGMLADVDCEIDVVADGAAAIEAAARRSYDVILMDCHMPDVDGFAATAAIRQSEVEQNRPRVPIVALSADVRKGIEEKCLEYGMDAYLSKPFERADLLRELANWFPPTADASQTDGKSDADDSAHGPEHIDHDVLERLRGIGTERGRNVLGSAIERYVEQAPALLDAARQAAADDDAERLFQAAHSLKSASANLGAVQLARTAAELEAAADARRLTEAGSLLGSIEAAVPQVCAELAALAGLEAPSKTPDANAVHDAPEILLVDDDPGFRLIASEALLDHGFVVSVADSGIQALKRVEELRPDLVVMDAIMPEMNGFDLCRRLLEDDAEIPVLMVTALDDIDSVNQAFEAGASGFTAKPVNFPVLVQQLRFVLRASHAEAELREQRCRLETAQRLGQLGYWRWSLSGEQFEMSEILKTMLCIEDDVSIDGAEDLFGMVVEPDRARVRASLEAVLDGEPQAAAEFQVMTACGDALDVRQVLQARRKAGHVDHVFGTIQDVTRERQAEAKIRKLAYFDELTGLASRTYFMQTLDQTIRSVQRSSECFAVLFIDLDGFKDVNDSLGHDLGDELLRIVANRLRDALREGDFIARLGGDEFCVIARNVSDQYETAHVAQRCIDESGQPVTLLSQQVLPRMSIGIAHYPDDGRSATSLIKAADSAMYAAKHAGKNGYAFYSPEMTRQAEQRLALENDIRSALDSDQLILHYQPQVSLATGRVVGVEALLRWNHPQQGMILPGEFIPIVERIGLIDKLGDFVIDRACAQMHRWQQDGVRPLNVSVNVSPLQLRGKTVAFAVAGALEEYGIDPGRLTLEVTETINQNDSEALAVLERLNELGVTIAIDDFGTGYSSLGSLKYLPIQCLKIDRVFVRDMLQDADDTVLLGAIVGLARALELVVVVEGVDAYEQVQVLAGIGCEIVQGYFFSAPITADQVPGILDTVFLPAGDSVHTAGSKGT